MKFKSLFKLTVAETITFDLFQNEFKLPASSTWPSRISIPALDQYIYEHMSSQVLTKRWEPDWIVREFETTTENVKKIRQAYFNGIFKAHEYELDGLAESMFFDYDPLVNYDKVETQTHNETLNGGERNTTVNTGARTQNQSIGERDQTNVNGAKSSTASNQGRLTTFDSGDYGKGSQSNSASSSETAYTDTVHNAAASDSTTLSAATDTTKQDSFSDSSNGGYTLTTKGNIGVTTSQQMLESERQVRQFNFFDRIVRILQSECCVADWEQEESFDFIYEGGGSGGGTGDTYSKAEIDGMMSRKADKTELSAYVTTATLNNKLNGYVKTADLVNYVTTTTLNQTLSTYAKVSDLSNYVSIDMLANYATITYVDEKIGAIGSVLDAINRRVI